ncbi:hypothetical protein HDU83_004751 [Entophlyctis luteolus]|nr:hypothetical protein HDU83_004751 [Entophlyctis luteolus]
MDWEKTADFEDTKQSTDALDALVTAIKPLLPKIALNIQSQATEEGKLRQKTNGEIAVQLVNNHQSASNIDESVVSKEKDTTINSFRRKSLKEIFRLKERPVSSGLDSTNLNDGLSTGIKITASEPQIQQESQSHPLLPSTLISDPKSDDTFALALASLCNALYRVIEPSAKKISPRSDGSDPLESTSNAFAQISALQDIDPSVLSKEQQLLWAEIDKFMTLVHTLCLNRCQSIESVSSPKVFEQPVSSPSIVLSPIGKFPQMERSSAASVLTLSELHAVADAIDRVARVAPKMFNQTVTLNARQERMMDEAALTSMIDRLFVGREDFQAQRASPDAFLHLSRLVDQIVSASKRSMDNQRVVTSASYQQKMEGAKMGNIIEAQERTRFKNQDWLSKETQLINELASLQSCLMKSCKSMTNQRVELSDAKEKELFLGRVMGRVQKDTGFDSQTAVSVTHKKKDEELDKDNKVIRKTVESTLLWSNSFEFQFAFKNNAESLKKFSLLEIYTWHDAAESMTTVQRSIRVTVLGT